MTNYKPYDNNGVRIIQVSEFKMYGWNLTCMFFTGYHIPCCGPLHHNYDTLFLKRHIRDPTYGYVKLG